MSVLHLKPGLLVAEAATRAGVSEKTIQRWIAAGDLDALQVNAKLFFVPESALERCLTRRAENVAVGNE